MPVQVSGKPNGNIPDLLHVTIEMGMMWFYLQYGDPPRLGFDDPVGCEWCDRGYMPRLGVIRPQTQYLSKGDLIQDCPVCKNRGEIPRSQRNAGVIAERGDTIMFKEKGITAKVVNVLVESIALGAMVPGGIEIGGVRYSVEPEPVRKVKRVEREPVRKIKRAIVDAVRKMKRVEKGGT